MPAHLTAVVTPRDLWRAWSFEPSVLIPLALTLILYLWGMRNARGAAPGRGIPAARAGCFLGAMLSLVVALVSPLDALSGALFSAHMVQHLILMLVSAPLFVLSEAGVVMAWALPRRWAQGFSRGVNRSHSLRRGWQGLTSPVSAWLLFAMPMWVWHASSLFEAALHHPTIHTLEHVSFLGTAVLFWWVLFRRTRAEHLHYAMAIVYLFTTMLHSGILGALMIFSAEPWYSYYAAFTGPWGLTPLEDQQLAGLIMWIPGGIVFTLLTIGYFAAWFRALERRSTRLEQSEALAGRQKTE